MQYFNLKIVTPDGMIFSDQVYMVSVRTVLGEIGIKARHIDYVIPLGMGECKVYINETHYKNAACIGGVLTVIEGNVSIIATTFEWAESIDVVRAQMAMEQAEQIELSNFPKQEQKKMQGRLRRAQVRLSVKNNETK